MLRNLSCRTLKVRKGIKIAHVETSNIVPTVGTQRLSKNVPKVKKKRIEKILESLDLQGIESWNEQQQSARSLINEYQHLFALTLNELGKTSFVQHDIKLNDETPFKERYRRIPPHQYEEVRKHL